MIVYSEPKGRFQSDVAANQISDRIGKLLRERTGRGVGGAERRSWQNSMQYVRTLLDDDEIPGDVQVSIEYTIPQTSKRIDVILSGQDEGRRESAVIIELKQWETVSATGKDGIVSTFLGGGVRDAEHPSYQAWTYAALLRDFNETVQTDKIQLVPCAYLHNCTSPEGILDDCYAEHLTQAPAFLKKDVDRLRRFIKRYVKYGDSGDLMFRIEQGRIRPSKALADALLSMLEGNREFVLIDDQKLVYEEALSLVDESGSGPKRVLIVEGGPGTGKSVVAINLLVEITARELTTQYVSRNAAPRAVYASKLTGTFKKTHIDNMFRGSGGFTESEANEIDCLIVDEAHRLNKHSGLYRNLGENQIKEIIHASRTSIFFIDEDQRVTIRDIGTAAEVRRWAEEMGAEVKEMELASQFRCNGSDGYLGWVDHALQIRTTANPDLEGIDYDFRVCDTPSQLRDLIFEKNREANKARLVAGYCWDWKSKKEPDAMDIEFPEFDFAMQWNLTTDGSLWIVKPESINEVGCIHTCQGLELDYVGVIIGLDFVVRDGSVVADATERSSYDSSVRGIRKMHKEDPERARELADLVVKNTYRTLMTRGQKGCYIYCTDPETQEYFRNFVVSAAQVHLDRKPSYEGLGLRIVEPDEVEPYANSVPVYDLQIAAGDFSEAQAVEDCDWVELPDPMIPREGYFVARVLGESMNRRVPNGAWCLFKASPGGSRNGKVVVVQHESIQDPDFVGGVTIKRYESSKIENEDGTWEHQQITLHPESSAEGYRSIVLDREDVEGLRVVGELVAVLD